MRGQESILNISKNIWYRHKKKENEVYWKGFHAGGKHNHWPCFLNPSSPTDWGQLKSHKALCVPTLFGSLGFVIQNFLKLYLECYWWFYVWDDSSATTGMGMVILDTMCHLYRMLFVRSCPFIKRAQNTQTVRLGFLSMSTTLDWLHMS